MMTEDLLESLKMAADDAAALNAPEDLDRLAQQLYDARVAIIHRAAAVRLRSEGNIDEALRKEELSENTWPRTDNG